MAVWVMTDRSARASLTVESVPKLLFGIIVPLLLVCAPLLVRRQLRAQYRKSPVSGEERTLMLDDIGVGLSSVSAKALTGWSVYESYAEDKHDFVLIQTGGRLSVPIPKQQMSSDDVAEIRRLLDAHLLRK